MINPGGALWTGSGHVDIGGGSILENQGTFDVQNDRFVFGKSGGGTF
jgi:hypothetical protein